MELRGLLPQPAVQAALVIHLPGENQRLVPQVTGRDGLPLCQGAVPPHEDAPGVLHGQLHAAVPGLVHVAQEDAEIQQALVQALAHVHGVAADDMEADARIACLDPVSGSGDLPYPVGLTGADIEIPADGFVGLGNFFFRPAHQVQDFLRPFSQQSAVFREGDLPVAPDHQLFAQLFFQIPQLAGEGGLGQVQGLGRRRDVLFPGHCKKVLQYAQFHKVHLLALLL